MTNGRLIINWFIGKLLAITKTWSLEKQLTSQEKLHRSYTHIVNSIQKIGESHSSITRLVWRFVSSLNIFTKPSFDYICYILIINMLKEIFVVLIKCFLSFGCRHVLFSRNSSVHAEISKISIKIESTQIRDIQGVHERGYRNWMAITF